MWIYACVLSPFVIAFVAGNFAIEDDTVNEDDTAFKT